MSIVSNITASSNVTGVRDAVQHLQELGARMTTTEFGLNQQDASDIDQIIEAIQDLENERADIHDLLEVETIEASKLRHRLNLLPGQIRAEIQDAVNSARQSNADDLNGLQEKLETINRNITFLEEKCVNLEADNSKLRPECDRREQDYQLLITQLNVKMSQKAGKQITLNETRNELRITREQIVRLEEDILQLKEDLIQERTDARMEKEKLQKCVAEKTTALQEQREINVLKKKKMDGLLEKALKSDEEVSLLKRSIDKYEMSKSKLDDEERSLQANYSSENKRKQDMENKRNEVGSQLTLHQTNFEHHKADVKNKLSELEGKIAEAQLEQRDLKNKQKKLQKRLDYKEKIRQEDLETVTETNSVLQNVKSEFAFQAQEIARLTQENVDTEAGVIETTEAHRTIIGAMSNQIQELEETLAKERSERLQLQREREKQHFTMDEFKVKTVQKLSSLTENIRQAKTQHEHLSEKARELKKTIEREEEDVAHLTSDREKKILHLSTQKKEEQERIRSMEKDIENMNTSKEEKQKLFEENLPDFKELERNCEETTQQFEELKKEIVGKKRQKNRLEDLINASKKELQKLTDSTVEMEQNLQHKRTEAIDKMRRQAEEMSQVEKDIYTAGHRIKTLLEENYRFREANEKLEAEIEHIKRDKQLNEELELDTGAFADRLRGIIGEEWSEDERIGHGRAAEDEKYVNELQTLLEHTVQRENKVSRVTDKLQTEISVLSQFLDYVSKRRPAEYGKRSRSKKRIEAKPSRRHLAPAGDASVVGNPECQWIPSPPLPSIKSKEMTSTDKVDVDPN